ncbi:MAG: aminotransferase class I/II-fold pyridoxal phosphate-dependent enzyme [Thermoguttaceae bacterium]|jgi:8-amino-7-oxononanoate synthase
MPQMESPPGPETMIDGRRYLYFAGTAYLGLQGHPEVVRAACEATERFGIGAATSRTLAGDTPPALEAERRAAAFFGTEDAFHVASGYMAPAVATALLAGRVDHVLIDEHAHASLRQAAAHLGVPVERFAHRDAESLALAIRAKTSSRSRLLVMTDGVFSADGAIAPLEDYSGVLAGHGGAVLLVDDAHGFGVLGENGRGTLEHTGLARRGFNREPASRSPALWACGTLSKALGGFGGILPGSRALIERIKRGTPYGAAASGPPVPVAAASARALEIASEHPELRERLRENAAHLKSGLRRMGLQVHDSPVPIAAIAFDTADRMRQVQAALAGRGVWIAYLPAYSGVGPQGVLRIAVFATHTTAMIDRLLEELASAV